MFIYIFAQWEVVSLKLPLANTGKRLVIDDSKRQELGYTVADINFPIIPNVLQFGNLAVHTLDLCNHNRLEVRSEHEVERW